MNEMNSELNTTENNLDGGRENRGYARSQSDHQLATFEEKGKINIKHLPRTNSASASTFPVIYEVPMDNNTTVTTDQPCTNTISPLPTHHHHSHRRSKATAPPERQSSLPDPMSDRVSTILVWQNLTVSTREDKRKEAFQRIKSYKTYVPKRKRLLNSLSGAITGGLWAVMGMISSILSSDQLELIIVYE